MGSKSARKLNTKQHSATQPARSISNTAVTAKSTHRNSLGMPTNRNGTKASTAVLTLRKTTPFNTVTQLKKLAQLRKVVLCRRAMVTRTTVTLAVQSTDAIDVITTDIVALAASRCN